ncbi:hypothetical protein [Acinetobacter sp.]|uniref:hypothetical protein n=1 Tax=Acinetobacter sp. TaxID=472 RepID=UPI00258AE89E|nr:hypothetical protein [Acinetobacter sp.]
MKMSTIQKGSALITILIIVILIMIIGAISVRSGLLGVKIATNSQAIHIMNQNTDAAFLKVEDDSQIPNYVLGTGLFGYPKLDENRGKELVVCYRGSSDKFYALSQASWVYLNNGQIKTQDIGGSQTPGFCQIDDSKKGFTSGRAAAMTQVSIRVGGISSTENPFDFMQEGTDGESGKLDDPVRLVATATTVMPTLSSASSAEINKCMQKLSYVDSQTVARDMTISGCLESISVPYKTQVSEYSLGQFIAKTASAVTTP